MQFKKNQQTFNMQANKKRKYRKKSYLYKR